MILRFASISLFIVGLSACGQPNGNNLASQTNSLDSSDEYTGSAFGLAGIGNHECVLSYRNVVAVKNAATGGVQYEYSSELQKKTISAESKGFGQSCASACASQLSRLQSPRDGNGVLFQGCQYNLLPKTASFRGVVESYSDGVIKGWACQFGQEASIKVELYLGGAKGSGKLVDNVVASEVDANAPLAKECGTAEAKHRFSIRLPDIIRQVFKGDSIYVHAVNSTGKGDPSPLLGNSGKLAVDKVVAEKKAGEKEGTVEPKKEAEAKKEASALREKLGAGRVPSIVKR
ncbi:MAG: hypothetical protein FJY29_13545 [Betaproteobacteria bacterium]|nr:hypothetical protein [Betaproteobacteria bacterium]